MLSPDDSVLYLASNSDYQIYGYDAITGNQLYSSSSNGYQEPSQIAVSTDGNTVYTTYQGSGHSGLRIMTPDLNLSSLDDLTPVDTTDPAEGLAVEGNGDVAVGTTGASTGLVTEYTSTGSPTGRSFTVGQEPSSFLLSRDGGALYIAVKLQGALYAVDTSLFSVPVGSYGSTGYPSELALTPDGLTLFIAGGGPSVNENVYPFSVAQVTLTGPAGVAHGAGPVVFTAQIADGQNPVGDYSTSYTVKFDVLNSSNAVVATATTVPNASGTAAATFDFSSIPSGTYSVRANLDPPLGAQVLLTATGFTVTAAGAVTALAATGTEAGAATAIGALLLLVGAAALLARRRRTA